MRGFIEDLLMIVSLTGLVFGAMWLIQPPFLVQAHQQPTYDQCRSEFTATSNCFEVAAADTCLKLIGNVCGVP